MGINCTAINKGKRQDSDEQKKVDWICGRTSGRTPCKTQQVGKRNKIKIVVDCNDNTVYKGGTKTAEGFHSKVYGSISNNKEYACKTLKKKDLADRAALKHINNEIQILKQLASPYIIKLISSFEHNARKYLIYPFYNYDLFSLIKLANKEIPEKIIKIILSQVYSAITYLHSKKIIFRDGKPENVLIDSTTGFCKGIDFGYAIQAKHCDNSMTDIFEIVGTNEYIPPEVAKRKGYGYEFDYWTFGVFAYEILNGAPPFSGKAQDAIFNDIINEDVVIDKDNASEEIKDGIGYGLKKEKEDRIDWSSIPHHPFFEEVAFDGNQSGSDLNSTDSNNVKVKKDCETLIKYLQRFNIQNR